MDHRLPPAAPRPNLRDERLHIRPLLRSDLDVAETWPPSSDPLADRPGRPLSLLEKESYLDLCHWPLRLELSIDNAEGRLVGRMHLRDISLSKQFARLGIIFGAPWVGQGYGSAAMRLFLPYFFGELGFRRMLLDVSAANRRALRLYEKFGFHAVGAFWREGGATRNLGWLQQPAYQHLAHMFRIEGQVYWALHYELELWADDQEIENT